MRSIIYVHFKKLCFTLCFCFGHEILDPQPETELVTLQWKHGVLTTGSPEKLFLKYSLETVTLHLFTFRRWEN